MYYILTSCDTGSKKKTLITHQMYKQIKKDKADKLFYYLHSTNSLHLYLKFLEKQ